MKIKKFLENKISLVYSLNKDQYRIVRLLSDGRYETCLEECNALIEKIRNLRVEKEKFEEKESTKDELMIKLNKIETKSVINRGMSLIKIENFKKCTISLCQYLYRIFSNKQINNDHYDVTKCLKLFSKHYNVRKEHMVIEDEYSILLLMSMSLIATKTYKLALCAFEKCLLIYLNSENCPINFDQTVENLEISDLNQINISRKNYVDRNLCIFNENESISSNQNISEKKIYRKSSLDKSFWLEKFDKSLIYVVYQIFRLLRIQFPNSCHRSMINLSCILNHVHLQESVKLKLLILNEITRNLFHQNLYTEAYENIQKMMKLVENFEKFDDLVIELLNDSALIYSQTNEHKKALEIFTYLLNVVQSKINDSESSKIGNKFLQTQCECNLAYAYTQIYEYQKAQNCFHETLEGYDKCNNLYGQYQCIIGIADILVIKKKYNHALQRYKEAINLSKNSNDIPKSDTYAAHAKITNCIRYKIQDEDFTEPSETDYTSNDVGSEVSTKFQPVVDIPSKDKHKSKIKSSLRHKNHGKIPAEFERVAIGLSEYSFTSSDDVRSESKITNVNRIKKNYKNITNKITKNIKKRKNAHKQEKNGINLEKRNHAKSENLSLNALLQTQPSNSDVMQEIKTRNENEDKKQSLENENNLQEFDIKIQHSDGIERRRIRPDLSTDNETNRDTNANEKVTVNEKNSKIGKIEMKFDYCGEIFSL
ncbi:hypothetical protein A3Q56_03112 [Intoshia linei]|uniref:Uncharacterized protein n=1 Tax=Intoshia linei TaxID=1819745 RepID=A0A177B688_9BILA|nr:hypothetical protein A3Q56_03112 [Intoshia linei]